MKELDISGFLKKAEELKALFVLGQRVIPFLEEIFIFVKDIKPLLDDINVSIEENLKKMPNASKQLSKVTEATELATTEIMDIVDGIVYKSGLIAGNLKHLEGFKMDKMHSPLKIYELIQKAVQEDIDMQELIPQISITIDEMKSNANKDSDEFIKQSADLLASIENDSNSIMMSLQVQDITSQQLAAVNNMIGTIQSKLTGILAKFQTSGMSDLLGIEEHLEKKGANISSMHRQIAFDPDAVDSLDRGTNRQSDVDMLVNSHTEFDSELSTQDNIDAMFAGANLDSNDPVAQDDIDALFAQPANNIPPIADNTIIADPEHKFQAFDDKKSEIDDLETISQEDIDALFGGK